MNRPQRSNNFKATEDTEFTEIKNIFFCFLFSVFNPDEIRTVAEKVCVNDLLKTE